MFLITNNKYNNERVKDLITFYSNGVFERKCYYYYYYISFKDGYDNYDYYYTSYKDGHDCYYFVFHRLMSEIASL